MEAKCTKKLSRTDYTVGWICALSIELAASSGMLDEVHQDLDQAPGDKNMYILGEICGHNIVMACLPAGNMGITPAANVAANMLRTFPKIRFGLMVGIGGGAPTPRVRPSEDIRLGDVVVSIPQGELGGAVKYDRGKVVANGEFQHMGLLNMPPAPLTAAVAKLKSIHERKQSAISRNVTAMIDKVMQSEDANPEFEEQYRRPNLKHDQLFQADYEHNEEGELASLKEKEEEQDYDEDDETPLPCRGCDATRLVTRKPRRHPGPVIHYGTIASADQVMRHGLTRDRIRKKYGVLCFEMEAAGLMNDFPCLVVRGICDYSDTHKHKIWQRYAAATAAAYTKELLEVVLKEDIEKSEDAIRVLERVQEGINHIEDHMETLIQDRHRQHREKVLNWLDSGDTHTSRLTDSYEKWQPNTIQQLLRSKKCLNWMENSDDTQTLWCHGIAGGGKTVFASVVVENLKAAQKNQSSDTKAGVACLFCEYDRQMDQTVRSLACGILRQLAEQCQQLPTSITDLFDLHGNDLPHLDKILTALTDVIQRFPRVFLVVDALDECFEKTRKELLSYLLERQNECRMKLLATSRPTIDFRKEFGFCEEMEIKANPEDVRHVLDALIDSSDSLVKADVELRHTVTGNIAGAVDGIFLLVQPFLDSIIKEWSRGAVLDALRALMESTDKISAVYEGALKRIGSRAPGDRKLAHRILSWIVESKRPLTRTELLHALAVTPGSPTFQDEYIINDLNGAVALCAGLVAINQRSNTVQMMHHTARSYLENRKCFEDHNHHLDCANHARRMVVCACVTYISFSVFGDGPCHDDQELENRVAEYPLLRYAAQHWGNHARDDQAPTVETEDIIVGFLQNEAKVASCNQVAHPINHQYPGYSQDFVRGVDGLHTAASFGLANIALRLIECGANTNAVDEDCRTALHRAAENGHDEVIRILTMHAAEVNTRETKHSQTALHLAALNGHMVATQTLLENGAEANLTDCDGWMAIHVAAWTGNEQVVRVLLTKNDVNETGKDGLTALHCAAAQGHQAVAQHLILAGADVDAQDKNGWTPLHWASKKRHDLMKPRTLMMKDEASTLLRQVLAKKEEINEALKQHFLAVQDRLSMIREPLAFWQGRLAWLSPVAELEMDSVHGDILKSLQVASTVGTVVLPWSFSLEETEPPPAPVQFIFAIQDELTALHCGIECGHESVARLLLRNGADILKLCRAEVEMKFFGKMDTHPAALHLAAHSGHTAIVRLLLEQGVDAHTRSGCAEVNDQQLGGSSAKWSPLHWAAISGSEEVVQLLLDRGADIHDAFLVSRSTMQCVLTPLHLAVILGHEKVIALLLSNGAAVNARGEVNLGNDIEINIGTGKDIKFNPRIGLTALHLAALTKRQSVVKILLEANADTEAEFCVDTDTMHLLLTALHITVIWAHKEAAHVLLESGASIKSHVKARKDKKMRAEITALHLAAFFDDKSLSELLIESGADVNASFRVDVDSWEPSKGEDEQAGKQQKQESQQRDDKPLLQRILERTAKLFTVFIGEDMADWPLPGRAVRAYGKYRQRVYTGHTVLTPLHIAIILANEQVAETLIEKEADANAAIYVNINNTPAEFAPIHLAAIRGSGSIVRNLIDKGTDIHAIQKVKVGRWLHIEAMPIHHAALSASGEAVMLLAEAGADLHAKLYFRAGSQMRIEATVLQLAALSGNENAVRLLLDRGFDAAEVCLINNDTRNALNALHLATLKGSMDVVQLLLERGSSVHTRAKLHCYNLHVELPVPHLAVLSGHQRVVELLLQENHDIHAKCRIDIDNWLHAELPVLHIAVLSGSEDILCMLLGAEIDVQEKALISGGSMRTELTVLHLAALSGRERILAQLLDTEIDIQVQFLIEFGTMHIEFTLLHLAVLWRMHDTFRLLLEKGVNTHSALQIEYEDGYAELTALHLAALFGDQEMVHTLLDYGAEANASCQVNTEEGKVDLTALHLATAWMDPGIMHLLLSTEPLAPSESYSRVNSEPSYRSHPASRSWIEPSVTSRECSNESYGEVHSRKSSHGSTDESLENSRASSRASSTGHSEDGSQDIEQFHQRTSTADVNATFLLEIETTLIRFNSIHIAALVRSPQPMQPLLDNDADANAYSKIVTGNTHIELTAFHIVVLYGSRSAIQHLLGYEVDTEARLRADVGGLHVELSPLHLAAFWRSVDVTELLLENHFDARAKCPVGFRRKFQAELSLLHLIALSEYDGIASLLSRGVDVHAKCLAQVELRSHLEFTARDIANVVKRARLVDLLSEYPVLAAEGQSQSNNDTQGRLIAFFLVAVSGHRALGEVVLELVDNINDQCRLKLQVRVDTVFKIPMEADADATFDINMEAGLPALHTAAGLGDVKTVGLLLDKGASLEGRCYINVGDIMQAKLSALHLAAMLKHDRVVQVLLERGVDASATSQVSIHRIVRSELIAPHLATLSGHEGILRLLTISTDVDVKIQAHLVALHFAAMMNDEIVARSLLEHGADVNASCLVDIEATFKKSTKTNIQVRLTALHVAAWAGHDRTVRLLLKKGADVNCGVQVGGTVSLSRGVQVNRKVQAGGTALHLAAGLGRGDVLRTLIDSGANLNAKSQDGRTPLQWAKDQGHEEAVHLMSEMLKLRHSTTGSGERGRFRQRWHNMVSKGGSSASFDSEEGNSAALRDDSPHSGNREHRREGIGHLLTRLALQKGAEKLKSFRHGRFSKDSHDKGRE